jgi:hypothetical protein
MAEFICQDDSGRKITIQQWLDLWRHNYAPKDENEYQELIKKHLSYSAEDFERIGQWKDGALKHGVVIKGRWKPNLASVAYDVWMHAASVKPKNPTNADARRTFLREWAERKVTYRFGGRTQDRRFGLSRASTLLHFLSAGQFPIFDSRVKMAAEHLTGAAVTYDLEGYKQTICPLVLEIQRLCGCTLRDVDTALFAYGAWLSKTKRKQRDAGNQDASESHRDGRR